MKQSYKYRSSKYITREYIKDFVGRKADKMVKGLNQYISDKIRKNWMLYNGISFVIPAGNIYFDTDGHRGILKSDTTV
jgi:predicted GNAT superfamily acetyltransferase